MSVNIYSHVQMCKYIRGSEYFECSCLRVFNHVREYILLVGRQKWFRPGKYSSSILRKDYILRDILGLADSAKRGTIITDYSNSDGNISCRFYFRRHVTVWCPSRGQAHPQFLFNRPNFFGVRPVRRSELWEIVVTDTNNVKAPNDWTN